MSPGAGCEVGFVGGGFRTTTFLASAWPQLAGAVEVFDAGDRLGAGAFADYAVRSTSVGSRFLKDVRFEGPFTRLRGVSPVAAVAAADRPVPLRAVAAALDEVGAALVQECGVRWHRGCRITSVHVDDDRAGVRLRTADGGEVRCRHVVLATGREERPHPDLAPWQAGVWPSGRVISASARPALARCLADLGGRPVVIAGCSHSAMSALRAILYTGGELHGGRSGFRLPQVVVLRRSPTRLMYPTAEQARAGQIPGREPIFDPRTDVCPETGVVFRDSGLRHESRALFCAAWAGRIPGLRVVQADHLADAAPLLSSAGLIVQALGYRGRIPDIVVNGELTRSAAAAGRLYGDEEGAVVLGGRRYSALSVLRAEPTPRRLRDNPAYGSRLYRRLAARLTRHLQDARARR